MAGKRRIFDIDIPDDPLDEPEETQADKAPTKRGPMASAITENAAALQARKSTAQAIREENDALAHEFVSLREAGQVVLSVPLEQVHTNLLVRDRFVAEDAELEDLVTSIRDIGLSNPIRVHMRANEEGYELIQGYRRLSAFKQLLAETGSAEWARIPALVTPGDADISDLYRRMVDENVIRKDLSFAEMAFAAQNFAADPSTPARDLKEAVATLFQSAPYSKRSYIRSFARLLNRLDKVLEYPAEIPRALGVTLVRAMENNPEISGRINTELRQMGPRSVEAELAVLRRYAGLGDGDDLDALPTPKPKGGKAGSGPKTKTTFNMSTALGQAKCTAAQGRLEIKLERDFSAIDRAHLERAIAALVDGLP